jgi:nucleotide-binding universal stress UspA family protein
MFERILVPVDGSELAERALPSAVALAHGLRCPAHLIQVIPLPRTLAFGPVVSAEVWNQVIEGSTEAASEHLERLQLHFTVAGVPATHEVRLGDPALQIIEQAQGPLPTLVVMATHGRGGFKHWALGSVAEKVVRGIDTPVYLVPAAAKAVAPPRRVLVPLDGSATAGAILPAALDISAALGADLTLLRAYPLDGEGTRRAHHAAWAYLQAEKRQLERPGRCVRTATRRGEAALEILEYACRHKVDAIAMATHGRSAVRRWALGSVADKVLHGAPVPVLLLRAKLRAE